jgi:hypothetical protein
MKDIDIIHDVLRVLEPHWETIEVDFHRKNERFLELAQDDHETIGRVLRAHLVIESFLGEFLVGYYGIDEIDEIDELRLTFAQKAKLLPQSKSSAAFVRPGIIQLNAVRNKFGHRLNHKIESQEISAIYEVLRVARSGVRFASPLEAIEAFAPVACAFLSVTSPELQQLLMEAFAHIRTYEPTNVG